MRRYGGDTARVVVVAHGASEGRIASGRRCIADRIVVDIRQRLLPSRDLLVTVDEDHGQMGLF